MEKILKILEENARISLEDIATMVESTPEEVAKQIDAYQQAHVINGYRALIDWDKAGADRVQAIIELRVSPKRDCGFDEVAANIARFDEVDSVMLMSGRVRPFAGDERQELSGHCIVRGKAAEPAGRRAEHGHAFRAAHL